MKKMLIAVIILSSSLPIFGEELHRMGLIYEDPRSIPRLKEKRMVEVKVLPPASVDHSANMPPVGSQGQQGSCVAWATGYYYKTYQEWVEHEWSVTITDHQFSPAFIYNQINGGVDEGSYFSDALFLLCDNGCASLTDCPYSDADYTTWPTETAYDNAIPFRCDDAYWIDCSGTSGINLLKQHIANGDNALISVLVWGNFCNINNYDTVFCVTDTTDSILGGHAQCIVGYDDNKYTNDGYGAFRVVNSWGTDWGNGGYYWMSYKALMHPRTSRQVAYYTTDKSEYSPIVKTRARISHPTRERVTIRMGVGPSGSPYWTKDFFNFYMSPGADYPFPSHNIVFDISDGNSYLDSTITNNVFARCTDTCLDGRTGTIDYFSCEQLDWEANSLSYETPVNIPDNGTPAYANLSITGGSGIPDIVVTPDTLQFTYSGTKSNIQVLKTPGSHRVAISKPTKFKAGIPSNTFARVSTIDPISESPRRIFSFDKPIKGMSSEKTILGSKSWVTYYSESPAYFTWETPERATCFDMVDFPNVQYPFYIKRLKNIFYEHSDYLWDSDQFTFKIYADDGLTLLYESPQLTAQRYPIETEFDLGADSVEITSSGFWVSVRPILSSGYPSCLADEIHQEHSFCGSPGSWTPWTSGEFAKYVYLSWGDGGSDTVKMMIVYNTGTANLNVTNITGSQSWITSISPTSFIVTPGNSQNVTVTVTKSELSDGTYYANLSIASNDPDMPTYLEPVKFLVEGVAPTDPDISVTPDTLKFSYGKSKSARLSVLEPVEDLPELTLPGGKRIVNTAPKSQIQEPTTLFFAGVKGTVDTLIYDDGDPGNGYYWGVGTRMAMRMSPSDSCTVLAVQYYCWSGTGTQTIDATLYEWTGSAPGSQLGSPVSVSMDESGGWRTADFSSQNINVSGDFIAAFCMNNDQTALGFDKIDCGRAWDYDGSSWSSWNETYFIRAIVEYGEGPVSDTVKQIVVHNTGSADLVVSSIIGGETWVTDINPTSFTVIPGDTHNVTVTVTRGELTNGIYYDSLLIYSNDPDENPYIEPVKFVVSGVINPPSLVAPDSGLHISDNTPLFDWNDVTGATKYWLQVDNDNSFSSPVIDDSTLTTSFYAPITPLADTLYYWRVCAGSGFAWSNWSSVWNFEIDTRSPGTPALISPPDSSWLNYTGVLFEWGEMLKSCSNRNPVPPSVGRNINVLHPAINEANILASHNPKSSGSKASPIHYILQVDTTSDFNTPIIDTTNVTYDTLTLNEYLYYWRVRAYDEAGNEGDFSEAFWFVVDTTSPVIDSTTQLGDTVGYFGPFHVDSKIIDNFYVKTATLFYRVNGSGWEEDTMGCWDVWYRGVIPEQTPADTLIIDYYITASDYADNVSRDPEEGNYSFKIFLTGIQETRDIPDRFVLFSPKPNPSVGIIKIQYGLPKKANVSLQIYDIQGRLVKSIFSGSKDAGYYRLWMDSKDLSSGIYFIRLETPKSSQIEKLIILR